MTRDEMIDILIPVMVNCGESPASARRRLWRMSTSALEREMLLRGIAEYEDPLPEEPGEIGDEDAIADMARRFAELTQAWLAVTGRKAA